MSGEDPRTARDTVVRVYARRERHGQRPLVVRAAVAAFGFLLLAVGAVLVLPVPEAGIPVLLAALGLLALEFDWAARLLAIVALAAERLLRRFRGLPLVARVASVIVPLAILLAIAVAILGAAPF